jgi:hypothetical protein
MKNMFSPKELDDIHLAEPFGFTKGCRTMKIRNSAPAANAMQFGIKLFNVKNDPGELREIDDPDVEVRLANALARMMKENEAPPEQFERMGIPMEGTYTRGMLQEQRDAAKKAETIEGLEGFTYEGGAYAQIQFALRLAPADSRGGFIAGIKSRVEVEAESGGLITKELVKASAAALPIPAEIKQMFSVYLDNAGRTT